MPIVISPDSKYGREIWKWDHRTDEIHPETGEHGMRPASFMDFPKMVYKAHKRENGKVMCLEGQPSTYGWPGGRDGELMYERACLEVESFNRSCVKIVQDDSALRIAKGQGWAETPQAAIELFERDEQAIGQAAAEAAYDAQRMSGKAQRELDAASAATHAHVTDVPAPKRHPRRRGPNKPKVKPVAEVSAEV